MSRVCTVCSHLEHANIDAALIAGIPNRRIAAQYGVSEQAVRRHAGEHLPAHLAQAQAAEDVAQADDLLAQVRTLHAKALTILATAEADGDLRTALAGIREARGCLELQAKLLGELSDAPQVNILVAPEWLTTRAALLRALAPFAEARIAVGEALIALEASHARSA